MCCVEELDPTQAARMRKECFSSSVPAPRHELRRQLPFRPYPLSSFSLFVIMAAAIIEDHYITSEQRKDERTRTDKSQMRGRETEEQADDGQEDGGGRAGESRSLPPAVVLWRGRSSAQVKCEPGPREGARHWLRLFMCSCLGKMPKSPRSSVRPSVLPSLLSFLLPNDLFFPCPLIGPHSKVHVVL